MADHDLTVLVTEGDFFEGPRWHDGQWYVSDLHRHTIMSYTESGESAVVVEADERTSGIGWLPDGSMLFVTMADRQLWRRSRDGEVSKYCDLKGYCEGDLNDMVVNSHGRAYLSNFGFDPFNGAEPATTGIIRVDPDRSARVAATELMFPNGMAIAPDGRTLFVGESGAGRYSAFAISDDGELVDRRLWAQLSPAPPLGAWSDMIASLDVVPDGCCADAEGALWVAASVGSRCIRVAEGGAILDEVRLPDELDAFACMLGGADGHTLLMCCAPGMDAARTGNSSATLMTTRVGVPHAGWP